MKRTLAALITAGALLVPATSHAFCGFYVSGADAKLFNNATVVVMMREGTRTVLSMQNNYQGPPKDFALVVPVPVVLQKENVKTLPKSVFERVDKFTAPRLVEYWEQDPCYRRRYLEAKSSAKPAAASPKRRRRSARDFGVKIEAKFAVGEYKIVILSAKESTGLDKYLRYAGYKIPPGAEPYLRPYVQAGTKFFVAKVDVKKVKFDREGQAMLSPLRFHYDSKQFNLPVRLGLMNSAGTQDLIVIILARGQRYEVANYKNVTIPTNLDLAEEAKKRFGAFYAALFDRTLAKTPGAVVTEYSWDAGSCDPCPSPPLGYRELALLGADALAGAKTGIDTPRPRFRRAAKSRPPRRRWRRRRRRWRRFGRGFVVTRLHARYTKDALGEDLVFRAAPPIMGGREVRRRGELEEGARPSSVNNFQARYAIRHPWTGPVKCDNPRWGRWGGPPGMPRWRWFRGSRTKPATNLAFAPRGGVKLASLVREDVPAIGLRTSNPMPKPGAKRPKGATATRAQTQPPPKKKRCGSCNAATGTGPGALLVTLLLLGWRRRRRRRGAQ